MAIAVLTPLVLLSGELGTIYSNVYFWDEFGFWLQMVNLIIYYKAFDLLISYR
jgi:hypothetical protein